MKDGLGSIRTDIQGQSGGAVAAAGERSDRRGCARDWGQRWDFGALARGSAWCRSHGAYPEELAKWRASATTALGAPEELRASPQATRQDRKRIKELERELLRKDRALAETAALLVLSKKVQAIFKMGEDE